MNTDKGVINELERINDKVIYPIGLLLISLLVDWLLPVTLTLVPVLNIIAITVMVYICFKKFFILRNNSYLFSNKISSYGKAKYFNFLSGTFVLIAGFLFVFGVSEQLVFLAFICGVLFMIYYDLALKNERNLR